MKQKHDNARKSYLIELMGIRHGGKRNIKKMASKDFDAIARKSEQLKGSKKNMNESKRY